MEGVEGRLDGGSSGTCVAFVRGLSICHARLADFKGRMCPLSLVSSLNLVCREANCSRSIHGGMLTAAARLENQLHCLRGPSGCFQRIAQHSRGPEAGKVPWSEPTAPQGNGQRHPPRVEIQWSYSQLRQGLLTASAGSHSQSQTDPESIAQLLPQT